MFSEDDCKNNINIREINRYVNGSLQNDFLFPEYTSDFQGCVLNITAHEIPPLLTFNGDVNNETHLMESYRLNGIEGDILKMLAKELNFEIHLTFPQERSIIRQFTTSTGSFKRVSFNKKIKLNISRFWKFNWNKLISVFLKFKRKLFPFPKLL